MSKELDLKSATKTVAGTKRLAGVKATYDLIFWGINTSQLSATMAGLHLEWKDGFVKLTHDSFPGEEKWLMAAGLKELTWKE